MRGPGAISDNASSSGLRAPAVLSRDLPSVVPITTERDSSADSAAHRAATAIVEEIIQEPPRIGSSNWALGLVLHPAGAVGNGAPTG